MVLLKRNENVYFCYRLAQQAHKIAEQRWDKERAENAKQRKHDQQLLEKMTKDRSHFETRWLIAISLQILHDIIVPNLALELYF